jgi:hypothetical protein
LSAGADDCFAATFGAGGGAAGACRWATSRDKAWLNWPAPAFAFAPLWRVGAGLALEIWIGRGWVLIIWSLGE